MVNFLGKSLSEEQLSRLTEHLRIDQFVKNEAVNYEVCKELGFMNNTGHFIRKGNNRQQLSLPADYKLLKHYFFLFIVSSFTK